MDLILQCGSSRARIVRQASTDEITASYNNQRLHILFLFTALSGGLTHNSIFHFIDLDYFYIPFVFD